MVNTDVAKEAAGVAGPPGSLIKALLTWQEVNATELVRQREILDELLELERRRILESKGVFSLAIRYRNAGPVAGYGGVVLENVNEVAKEKVRAVSLITAPAGAAGATPETENVYLKFGRGMTFEGAETTPSSFDLVFARGGKLNRFRTSQGIESIQLYSLTAFDAVLYMTAGSPEALPSF